ncbi:MAG: cadherin-like domain-containing protein, partial [Pseudomonadota bacterium]|nr:cadherin-like domain-containing protein [Pseudomonadota bacterium]
MKIADAELLLSVTDDEGDTLTISNVKIDDVALADTSSVKIYRSDDSYMGPQLAQNALTNAVEITDAIIPATAPSTIGNPRPAIFSADEGTFAYSVNVVAGVTTYSAGYKVEDSDTTTTVWTYQPAANYNTGTGAIALTYDVSDGVAEDDRPVHVTDKVTIKVNPVVDIPAPAASPYALTTIDEDNTTVISEQVLLDHVVNPDARTISFDTLTVDAIAGSSPLVYPGNVTDNFDGTWTFTPSADYNGPVSFSYTVRDDANVELAGDFKASLSVSAVNDPPVADFADTLKVDEDGTLLVYDAQLLRGATDMEGDSVTVSGTTPPSVDGTSLSRHQTSGVDTDFTVFSRTDTNWTPDYSTVSGGGATQELAAAVYLDADGTSTYEVYKSTADNKYYAYKDDGSGSFQGIGEVTQAISKAWAYTPPQDFSGFKTLSYKLTDDGTPPAESTAKTVQIDITPIDDAPVITLPASSPSVDEGAEQRIEDVVIADV